MKKTVNKEISRDFATSSKQQQPQRLLSLIADNPDFILTQNTFLEANSVNFGKNCFLEPKLIEFAQQIQVDKMSCFKGMVYQKRDTSQLLAYQNIDQNLDATEDETVSSEPQKKHQIMSDIDFQAFMERFFVLTNFTDAQKNEARNFYISRLKFTSDNSSFLFEQISSQKSTPDILEKSIQKIIRYNPELVVALIEKTDLDVNTQYPLYANNIAHHYFFYKSEVSQAFLDILKQKGFNPNNVNNFGETPLGLLLNNNKIDMALEFLKTFKDSLDVNLKIKGKTYLHKIILLIESSSQNLHYSDSRFLKEHNKKIEFFENLIHFSPAIDIRSGEKSRGTTAISYLEKKITNKDLAQALKSKILLELEFGQKQAKQTSPSHVEAPKKRFKL